MGRRARNPKFGSPDEWVILVAADSGTYGLTAQMFRAHEEDGYRKIVLKGIGAGPMHQAVKAVADFRKKYPHAFALAGWDDVVDGLGEISGNTLAVFVPDEELFRVVVEEVNLNAKKSRGVRDGNARPVSADTIGGVRGPERQE